MILQILEDQREKAKKASETLVKIREILGQTDIYDMAQCIKALQDIDKLVF